MYNNPLLHNNSLPRIREGYTLHLTLTRLSFVKTRSEKALSQFVYDNKMSLTCGLNPMYSMIFLFFIFFITSFEPLDLVLMFVCSFTHCSLVLQGVAVCGGYEVYDSVNYATVQPGSWKNNNKGGQFLCELLNSYSLSVHS